MANKEYIIIDHCGNPQSYKEYLAIRHYSGTLEDCAKIMKQLYDEWTEDGFEVTDCHGDPIDGDTLMDTLMAGGYFGYFAMQVNNESNDFHTMMEV
jgi:hypothetical protein